MPSNAITRNTSALLRVEAARCSSSSRSSVDHLRLLPPDDAGRADDFAIHRCARAVEAVAVVAQQRVGHLVQAQSRPARCSALARASCGGLSCDQLFDPGIHAGHLVARGVVIGQVLDVVRSARNRAMRIRRRAGALPFRRGAPITSLVCDTRRASPIRRCAPSTTPRPIATKITRRDQQARSGFVPGPSACPASMDGGTIHSLGRRHRCRQAAAATPDADQPSLRDAT